MKKANLFLLIIFYFAQTIHAQNVSLVWAKRMGSVNDEMGRSVTIDGIGNVYTTGFFQGTVDFDPGVGVFNLTSAGSRDIFVSKLDGQGNFIWAKSFGGIYEDWSYSIAVDNNGNVYTTGFFAGTADFDPGAGIFNLNSASAEIFISKLDAQGNFIWAKQMGGIGNDLGLCIKVDNNGNVYTTGYFEGIADFDPDPVNIFNLISTGSIDIFVSKLDGQGNFIWAKQMGGTNTEHGYSLAIDNQGNVYTFGTFLGTADFDPDPVNTFNLTAPIHEDIFISKLDPSGNFIWAKQMGGDMDDAASSMTLDNYANVYITGRFQDTADFDPGVVNYNLISEGQEDVFISKLDSSGHFIWAKKIGGTTFDEGNSLALDSGGSIFTIGRFSGTVDFDPGPGVFNLTSVGNADIFILKLDNLGNFLWAKQIGGLNSSEYGYSIAADNIGNVYAAGNFTTVIDFDPNAGIFNMSSAGSSDVFVVKLSPCFNTNSTISVTACDTFLSPSGTSTWTNTGTYTDIISNINGCDSIVTINLTIKNSTASVISANACYSYISPSGNYTWTGSGTYMDTIPNAAGCDSSIIVNLSINYTTSFTSPIVCDSFVSPSNNYTWTTSGIYKDTIPNAAGCDSIITFNLTVKNSSAGTDSPIACNSYVSPSTNYIWTSSGVYADTILNVAGCDSFITINLTINTVDTSITQNGLTLTANITGGAYQWVDCNNNYLPLNGETSQSYTVLGNGSYAVLVTQNGCTDTSSCYTFNTLGLATDYFGNDLKLYPNPTSGKFYIDLGSPYSAILAKIMTPVGQLLSTEEFVNSERIEITIKGISGIYFVELSNNLDEKVIIRIVKE